jgi:LPXTG-motif cell wall-anchored protein
MPKNRNITSRGIIIALVVLMNSLIFNAAYTGDENYYPPLLVALPLLLILLLFVWQRKRD